MISNKTLAYIDDVINKFENGNIMIADDIPFSNKRVIKQVTHYISSKYLDNLKDEFGNEYRFRNIGNAIVDLEFRAKNLDRKNIEAYPDDNDYVFAMILNKEIQKFLKDNQWGEFIDDFQIKKSQYGEVMVKKTRDEVDIVEWNNMYFNPKNINGGVKIEKHSMTPQEIRDMGWEHETEECLKAHEKNKEIWEEVTIYDIEDRFAPSVFDEDGDDEPVLMNVILGEVSDKKYLLFKTELDKSRFMSFSRKKIEGRDFGVGVWEELFEPQIAINQMVIDEQETMSLSGKVLMRTNKKDLPDAKQIINGEMVYLNQDEYLDTVSLMPSGGLAQYQNAINNWFENAQRDQSAFSAVTGEEPKAGTPFAALALQAQQSGSIFNKRRDQDGYNIRDILLEMVLPDLVKKINKEHELTAAYSPVELEIIDQDIKNTVKNKKFKEKVLEGELVTEEFKQQLDLDIDSLITKHGKSRKVRIPKGYITMDKIRKKITWEITDEQTDQQRRLNAITTVLPLLQPNDPQRLQLIDELMQIQGVSPSSFPQQGQPQPQQQSQPQGLASGESATQQTIKEAVPKGQQ